jgi:hypothetical protein
VMISARNGHVVLPVGRMAGQDHGRLTLNDVKALPGMVCLHVPWKPSGGKTRL